MPLFINEEHKITPFSSREHVFTAIELTLREEAISALPSSRQIAEARIGTSTEASSELFRGDRQEIGRIDE